MTARMGLAIAGALLLAGCAQGPERVVERRDTMAPAPRGPSLLKTAMMDGHNAARAAVGVAPLTWSDTLATTARAYAEELARTGKFAHAPQPQGMSREGENLWTGTRYAYAYPEMIGHWVAEKRDFINQPGSAAPASSRTLRTSRRSSGAARPRSVARWRATRPTTIWCAATRPPATSSASVLIDPG
jgi:hypothetical protein